MRGAAFAMRAERAAKAKHVRAGDEQARHVRRLQRAGETGGEPERRGSAPTNSDSAPTLI